MPFTPGVICGQYWLTGFQYDLFIKLQTRSYMGILKYLPSPQDQWFAGFPGPWFDTTYVPELVDMTGLWHPSGPATLNTLSIHADRVQFTYGGAGTPAQAWGSFVYWDPGSVPVLVAFCPFKDGPLDVFAGGIVEVDCQIAIGGYCPLDLP